MIRLKRENVEKVVPETSKDYYIRRGFKEVVKEEAKKEETKKEETKETKKKETKKKNKKGK